MLTQEKPPMSPLKASLKEALIKPLPGFEGLHQEFGDLLMDPEEMMKYRFSPEFKGTTPLWGKAQVKSVRVFGAIIANSKSLTEKQQAFTLYDFYRYYESVYNDSKNPNEFVVRKEGQSFKEYVLNQSQIWGKIRGGISPRIALTEVFIRIFLQSWEGLLTEMIVIENIRESLPSLESYASMDSGSLCLREPTSEEDHLYNCDIMIEDRETGKTVLAVQIKPASYFHAHPFTEGDKLRNRRKDTDCERDKGFRVYYVDREKSVRGEPLTLIRSESIVAPYQDEYKKGSLIKVIQEGEDGSFMKACIRAPYKGF